MNELAEDMQIWAVGAKLVLVAVGFEKHAKKPTKCTGTHQAGGLLVAFWWPFGGLFDGKLVIDANHGPIHLTQAAFYAVKLEVQRR